jgi:hypothetical protein
MAPPKEMPGPAGPQPRPRFGNGNGNGGTAAPGQPSRPARGRGRQDKGQGAAKGKGIGVGGAALPGPGGRQLAARVSSGKITSEQAQRTMQQRQTLAKAFGKDWREKLSVGGQSFAGVRGGLKKKPGNAKLAAINKKLLANRKAMLEAARKKNAGGKDGEEESEE